MESSAKLCFCHRRYLLFSLAPFLPPFLPAVSHTLYVVVVTVAVVFSCAISCTVVVRGQHTRAPLNSSILNENVVASFHFKLSTVLFPVVLFVPCLYSPRRPPDMFFILSLSGASFEVLCLGRWWASLDRDMWPPGQEAAVTEDFEVNRSSLDHSVWELATKFGQLLE